MNTLPWYSPIAYLSKKVCTLFWLANNWFYEYKEKQVRLIRFLTSCPWRCSFTIKSKRCSSDIAALVPCHNWGKFFLVEYFFNQICFHEMFIRLFSNLCPSVCPVCIYSLNSTLTLKFMHSEKGTRIWNNLAFDLTSTK